MKSFNDVGIEVESINGGSFNTDEFNILRETLERVGIANKLERKLYQSCMLLHKKGRYKIMYFKELFLLDGKSATIMKEELNRRNHVVKMLSEWNLFKIKDKNIVAEVDESVLVLSHKQKQNWEIIKKYHVGE